MKIEDIVKEKATISFEVFPPKNKDGDITSIYETIDALGKLKPDFISVTYGAGGSSRRHTVEIASQIKQRLQIEPLAHLTCISSTKEEIREICGELKDKGIENILAMRGDYPRDEQEQISTDFHHANELDTFIEEEFPGDFCLAGACYPEGHQEADCLEDDLNALKKKVDAGAKFLITQIFFDNQYYYRLVKEARKIGITVPILAGIMPITNAKSILRTTKMCGCSVPFSLSSYIQKYYHYPEAMKEIGVNFATSQIVDLIANGVDGIHLYTMNRPEIAQKVFENIPTVLREMNHV